MHLVIQLSIYLCHTILFICLHCGCNRYHSIECHSDCLVPMRASDRTRLDISTIGNWKKFIAFTSFDELDFVYPVSWFLERRGIPVKVWCDPNAIHIVPYLARFAPRHHRSIAILSMYPDLAGLHLAFINQVVLETHDNDLRILRHDARILFVGGVVDLLKEIWIISRGVELLHHVDRRTISIYNP